MTDVNQDFIKDLCEELTKLKADMLKAVERIDVICTRLELLKEE